MAQTRLSNVSPTQSEKLSARPLKPPPTMTSKQPAVFLTRYVWSRNRPVCSLRESPSSSSKFPPSEKIRMGNTNETKPLERSSSVSMRPPGSPVWPPRSLRWSKRWDASNAPLTMTAKYQPTARSEKWLSVPVSRTFSTLPTVQMPTLSQNQVLLSTAQATAMCPAEMIPQGSIEASVKMSSSPRRVPSTSGTESATSAKPAALGNTSKNFVGNSRARNGSSRAARRALTAPRQSKQSTTAPRQSQQSMRWPPRSVKWPNRWNKFSSVSQHSSETSTRSTESTLVPSDTTSAERPSTPTSSTSPRLQRNPTHPEVLERLPIKETSISKDVESSLESSPVSSPLSERSSQWTDSAMSPVGSTQSSSASVWSPTGPTGSPSVQTKQLALGLLQSKEPGHSEMKPLAQKCGVRSTTSSVSSSQTPEKLCSVSIQSTGQPLKSGKLQGQLPLTPTVSSKAKRLQRKCSEFSKEAADDTSSSLDSSTQSPSPTPPLTSARVLKPEVKLVRSATWPTELTQKPRSTHLLPEYIMKKESESESPFTSQRMASEPLRPCSSASAISLLKKSSATWERKSSSAVSLLSSVDVPCVSEHRITRFCGSSTTFENMPISCKAIELPGIPPRSSTKCVSELEKTRTSVSSPTMQKYSSKLTSSSTVSLSFNDTRMARTSIPVSQAPTKELKETIGNAATLLVWPTKSSPSWRSPALTASTTSQGGSWNYHRSSQRYQVWPQTESIPMNSLPMPSVSSESLRVSQATFSAGATILDKGPAYSGVRSAEFSQSSSESSKSWPSHGTSINVLPGHLISSVTKLSVSSEEAPVYQKPDQNVPRMLRKSSPVPHSLPPRMLPLTESSSARYSKTNTRPMMAPTLTTKFQSRSAFFDSSSDTHLAHSSMTPSWPLLAGTPDTPSMTPVGQSDRYWTEARSCLAEQNLCASHLAAYSEQSRDPALTMSSRLLHSPKVSSQPIPAESEEIPQKSCPRQSLCFRPHSPSFQRSPFLTTTTNIIIHTTASFPSVYSSSPSASCCVTQTSVAWTPVNVEKPVTSQAPTISTSNARHVPFSPSPRVAIQPEPSASLSLKTTDRSEAVPGVSHTAAQLVTPRMWMPPLETPPSSLQRKALPPRSEINVRWTSNSSSKHPVSSADTHSQLNSSTCASARLPAPPWTAAASAFPSITSTATEPRMPMFNWIASGPFWMSAHSASSTTTHLISSATPAATRPSPTWASSAAQLSTVVPSSKGPVVSAVVQTSVPQSEPSVSWSRSRPAAWSSTSGAATTGVLGFHAEPSSGLVRLPIKYTKRQPLPRTGDIESASSSTS